MSTSEGNSPFVFIRGPPINPFVVPGTRAVPIAPIEPVGPKVPASSGPSGSHSSAGQDSGCGDPNPDPEGIRWLDDEEENVNGRDSTETLEISPQGDIILELSAHGGSSGKLRFVVASQVLCLASSVFLAMLGPSSSFKEATELRARAHAPATSEKYVLPIEDDDPKALEIILNAIHLQNSKVPRVIRHKKTIWNMAMICDKYDLIAAFTVWVEFWSTEWKESALRDPGHGCWLFIAWQFGLADVFTVASKKIILEGYYTKRMAFLSKEGWDLDYLAIAVPEPVMKSISQQREAAITAMIQDTRSYLEKYLAVEASKPICSSNNPTFDCDLMILGSLFKEYQSRIGLYPDHERFLLMSVSGVEKILKSISLRVLGTNPSGMGAHGRCNPLPELFTKVSCTVSQIEGLKLESFKSRQGFAAKMGMDLYVYNK